MRYERGSSTVPQTHCLEWYKYIEFVFSECKGVETLCAKVRLHRGTTRRTAQQTVCLETEWRENAAHKLHEMERTWAEQFGRQGRLRASLWHEKLRPMERHPVFGSILFHLWMAAVIAIDDELVFLPIQTVNLMSSVLFFFDMDTLACTAKLYQCYII